MRGICDQVKKRGVSEETTHIWLSYQVKHLEKPRKIKFSRQKTLQGALKWSIKSMDWPSFNVYLRVTLTIARNG